MWKTLIERIIPAELDYLGKYDRMTQFINDHISLPDTAVDLLIKFLDQNGGKLSKRRREKFEEVGAEEIKCIEKAFRDIFMEA